MASPGRGSGFSRSMSRATSSRILIFSWRLAARCAPTSKPSTWKSPTASWTSRSRPTSKIPRSTALRSSPTLDFQTPVAPSLVCSRQRSRWTRSLRRERARRPADLKNGEANLRLRRVIQAKCAFTDFGKRFAIEPQRKFFRQRTRAARKVFKTFRAQQCGVDEAEGAAASLRGLFHQFHQHTAHRIARIDFHDGLEPRYAGSVAINKSINADWPDEIHRAQFRFQPRKNFLVKTQQASGSVRRPGKQRDDARRNPLVMM